MKTIHGNTSDDFVNLRWPKMTRNLTVSVCLASYNGERYIEEQILSIIKQFQNGDELIVSDDGSSDNTVAIIQKMQKIYPCISLYPGPKMGFSCNFGNAAKYAQNDIIMYSDQDDIWCKDKLSKICNYFQKYSKYTTILHNMRTFDENPDIDTDLFSITYHKGVLRNFIKSSYWGCCIAVKREFLQAFLPFRDFCVGHDQITGLMSEKFGNVYFMNEKLIYHRVHGDNTSLKRKTVPEMIEFRRKLYHDYISACRMYRMRIREASS